MTTTTNPPADQPSRDRIHNDLQSTLFVEAGAGTGKTTALVQRIVNLVSGGVDVRRIAAITFTEAAAAELKDRVRTELERRHAASQETSVERGLCKRALDDLDGAAMQTLHAFAQRILAAYPLEAGLPPQITVLDQIRADIAFDDAWEVMLDKLMRDDNQSLGRALSLGLQVKHLRIIAEAFGRNLDRLAEASFDDQPFVVEREPITEALARAIELAEEVQDFRPQDKLVEHIIAKQAGFELMQDAANIDEFLPAVVALPKLTSRYGDKDNWKPVGGKGEVTEVLQLAEAERVRLLDGARTECLMPVLAELRDFTIERAEERRRQGTLEFDDLLVLARNLLRNNTDVRKAVSGRYDHILIDEFQDTDPIQVEIAALLAAAQDDVAGLRWDEIPVKEGKLFFVGDPKQSIYRFRRADILLYQAAQRRFGGHVSLTANFRSRGPILEWVNQVFGEVIGAAEREGQPAYEALTPERAWPEDGAHPVHLIGRPLTSGGIDQVREEEASQLVALLHSIRGNWEVGDGSGRKMAEFRDIAILIPSRLSFTFIERELEAASIPFRLESRSLLFATQEVVDLTNILAALDDPTDDISIVAALRSPGFGCADDELFEFVQAGGRWSYVREQPASVAGSPVTAGLEALRELHDVRWWLSVSELVERVIRERKLLEVAFAHRRSRETWQRLRFVQEQARGFDLAGQATVRKFVSWLRTQADEASRVAESVVPESDDDAVRVLTIHAAKGLEFPIVVLAGLSRETRDERGIAYWPQGEETPEVRVGTEYYGYFGTPGFEAVKQTERDLAELEDDRLFYVAATRARDHLVVSLFHKAGQSGKPPASHAAHAYAICVREGMEIIPEVPKAEARQYETGQAAAGAEVLEARAAWIQERERIIAENRRARSFAATAIAHELAGEPTSESDQKPEQEDPQEPWRRGRAGTSIGRAVHAVLQTIDLATGEGVAEAAAAQSVAEGIAGREHEIEELVHAALASNAVREAVASGRFWREVYVASNVDGTVVEGFIDLLYETDDGLVVVDYKTDAAPNEAAVMEAMQRYRLQGAAYALALREAMPGRRVAKCVFVFVRPKMEPAIDDLDSAVSDVRRLLATPAAAAP